MNFNKFNFKGGSFGETIDNAKKFKELTSNIIDSKFETIFPYEFLKNIALNSTIVKHRGKLYLKDYSYKGTLSSFEFLDNENFVKALECIDRPKIRTIK
jgi:hypothetical protein